MYQADMYKKNNKQWIFKERGRGGVSNDSPETPLDPPLSGMIRSQDRITIF